MVMIVFLNIRLNLYAGLPKCISLAGYAINSEEIMS